MTYSIVARDPETGLLGVAVQSRYFSVGSVVTWGEAGVGVVATQAFVNPSYGPLGLDLMRDGTPAPEALAELLGRDPGADVRQVAMVDANGRVGVHTGARCIAGAGHVAGDGYSVQANMMLTDTVPDAMSTTYERASGDLVDRLLAALDAAEEQGGDVRGRQSAAILVVGAEPADVHPALGRVLEVRVDDHADPIVELRRAVGVKRAYDAMNRGDFDTARSLEPNNVDLSFWHAIAVAAQGRVDDARAMLAPVFAAPTGDWRALLERLPAAGLLPEELVLAILEKG